MDDGSRSRDDIVEQLSELSDLAHRGRSDVVNVGPLVLIWGVAVALAALLENFSVASTYTVAAWTVPLLLAYAGSVLVIRNSRSDDRALTWRSRALHRIWATAGAAIVLFNVGEELRRSGLQSESEAATALILAIAALTTADLTNRKLLAVTGVGWMVVALSMLVTAPDNALLPTLAVAAFALQIVPGFHLTRRGSWT